MATNELEADCSPAAVFAVLADGWLYPTWVVGASRMRDVDDRWPEPGSRLHHSVGAWPALLDDITESLEWQPRDPSGVQGPRLAAGQLPGSRWRSSRGLTAA